MSRGNKPSTARVKALATLSRQLYLIAGILDDEDGMDEDLSWLRNHTEPPETPPRGATYAIKNAQELDAEIHGAIEVAESLPDHPLIREVEAALHLTHESLGQCEVPAEFALTDGAPDVAVSYIRAGFASANERCHRALQVLAAQLSVAARRGLPSGDQAELPKQDDVHDGPVEPSGFLWCGTPYSGLPPIPFRLVKYLWTQAGRAADFEALAEPVWGDKNTIVDTGMVGSARKKANKFFERHGIPFKLTLREKDHRVWLDGPKSP